MVLNNGTGVYWGVTVDPWGVTVDPWVLNVDPWYSFGRDSYLFDIFITYLLRIYWYLRLSRVRLSRILDF